MTTFTPATTASSTVRSSNCSRQGRITHEAGEAEISEPALRNFQREYVRSSKLKLLPILRRRVRFFARFAGRFFVPSLFKFVCLPLFVFIV